MSLTSQQRQYLKGLAHGKKPPLFQIGRSGLSESAIATINKALSDHQLIKVNFLEKSEIDREAYAEELCALVKAELVQVLGFKATLYRHNPEKDDPLDNMGNQ